MFNDVCYLYSETVTMDEDMNESRTLGEPREVFCQARSIGMREFYAAQTAGLKPDITLVLADYYDYDNEKIVGYRDKYYDVTRTYIKGNGIELVLTERLARIE
jgi:hypothetical protein